MTPLLFAGAFPTEMIDGDSLASEPGFAQSRTGRLWLDNGHLHRSRVVDGVPLHCDQGRKAQQSDNGEAGDDPSLPDRLARGLAPAAAEIDPTGGLFP